MDIHEVLKYPLGPLPWSLATPNGVVTKTLKAKLLHTFEEKVEPVEDVTASVVLIFDGMAMVQSLKVVSRTFSELASHIFHLMKMHSPQESTRTDLIMDQYYEVSIKNTEREKHSAEDTIQTTIQGGNQKSPPQRKKYLIDSSNNINLASFLVNKWQQPQYIPVFKDFGTLYITHGTEHLKLAAGDDGTICSRVHELCTQQEEADIRILLHANHAATDGY